MRVYITSHGFFFVAPVLPSHRCWLQDPESNAAETLYQASNRRTNHELVFKSNKDMERVASWEMYHDLSQVGFLAKTAIFQTIINLKFKSCPNMSCQGFDLGWPI